MFRKFGWVRKTVTEINDGRGNYRQNTFFLQFLTFFLIKCNGDRVIALKWQKLVQGFRSSYTPNVAILHIGYTVVRAGRPHNRVCTAVKRSLFITIHHVQSNFLQLSKILIHVIWLLTPCSKLLSFYIHICVYFASEFSLYQQWRREG